MYILIFIVIKLTSNKAFNLWNIIVNTYKNLFQINKSSFILTTEVETLHLNCNFTFEFISVLGRVGLTGKMLVEQNSLKQNK